MKRDMCSLVLKPKVTLRTIGRVEMNASRDDQSPRKVSSNMGAQSLDKSSEMAGGWGLVVDRASPVTQLDGQISAGEKAKPDRTL